MAECGWERKFLCNARTIFGLIPEGFSKVAQCFSVGLVGGMGGSPEGTAEARAHVSAVPPGLLAFSVRGPNAEASGYCGASLRDEGKNLGALAKERPGSHQSSRKAAAIGSRAARMAGKSPPTKPMRVARITPPRSRGGVTAKAKVTWLKLCQLIVEVWNPLKAR
jgi:hypothetical protein